MRADLLIGGTLGGAALTRLDPATIATVVTESTRSRRRRRRSASRSPRPDQAPRRAASSCTTSGSSPRPIGRYDGLWNLHPGLLPWGRGFYPVFWAL